MNKQDESLISDMEKAAIKAARECVPDLCPSWRAYLFESVANGIIVTGSNTTVYKRGRHKGRTKWVPQGKLTVFIPRQGPFQPAV